MTITLRDGRELVWIDYTIIPAQVIMFDAEAKNHIYKICVRSLKVDIQKLVCQSLDILILVISTSKK